MQTSKCMNKQHVTTGLKRQTLQRESKYTYVKISKCVSKLLSEDYKECLLNFQVPEEKCVSVPREECKQVPKEDCKQVPKQACTPVYVCQVCQAPTYAAGRR